MQATKHIAHFLRKQERAALKRFWTYNIGQLDNDGNIRPFPSYLSHSTQECENGTFRCFRVAPVWLHT